VSAAEKSESRDPRADGVKGVLQAGIRAARELSAAGHPHPVREPPADLEINPPYFLRGSSLGSTYVISNGPVLDKMSVVTPFALTKCVIFCGIDA
jgi:hypothetical protein